MQQVLGTLKMEAKAITEKNINLTKLHEWSVGCTSQNIEVISLLFYITQNNSVCKYMDHTSHSHMIIIDLRHLHIPITFIKFI